VFNGELALFLRKKHLRKIQHVLLRSSSLAAGQLLEPVHSSTVLALTVQRAICLLQLNRRLG
jgi:hypothetical protein